MNEENSPKISITLHYPSSFPRPEALKRINEEIQKETKAMFAQFMDQQWQIMSGLRTSQEYMSIPSSASRHMTYGDYERGIEAIVYRVHLAPTPERMAEMESQEKLEKRKKETMYAGCKYSTKCRELLCTVEPTRDTCEGCNQYSPS